MNAHHIVVTYQKILSVLSTEIINENEILITW